MKKLLILSMLLCMLLPSCANNTNEGTKTEKGETPMHEMITAEDAKKIMDTEKDFVILDVREQEEFAEGHIKGAILLPYTEIESKAEAVLPDKDKLILVYCRSGRRSKIAAESLVSLGYTNVKEFGGIIDWPYEVVK
ncbi:MAG: rhodanese-like domain-containing protein [Clostridia bacterium]|nr:rhodanese-like domain-containing protein [Clostridia bacterium]